MTALFLALLWASPAFGQDETEVTPTYRFEAPNLAEGITMVPSGSTVILRNDDDTRSPFAIPGKYWLLPDSYYREAIIAAKQLPIYETALDRCTERALAWQQRTADALDTCLEQFDHDDELDAQQVQTIATLEGQVTTLTVQRNDARRQRNVAWAITGGVILGATAATVIAVAP